MGKQLSYEEEIQRTMAQLEYLESIGKMQPKLSGFKPQMVRKNVEESLKAAKDASARPNGLYEGMDYKKFTPIPLGANRRETDENVAIDKWSQQSWNTIEGRIKEGQEIDARNEARFQKKNEALDKKLNREYAEMAELE